MRRIANTTPWSPYKLSAYFRDIAHKKTMLELLHDRDKIQAEARLELRDKFHEFDIECVDVL
ncbi:MAG: hypothetical protein ACKOCW_02065, partial [Planctomycetaceae bacterium]